jgi:hypothetical protein
MRHLALTIIWAVLMAAAVLLPAAAGSSNPGDDQLRLAIHVGLLFYFVACLGMALISPRRWQLPGVEVGFVRDLWSLGWLSYGVHVILAFHYFHHWSHAHAVAHTREVSGLGGGIFVTHFFTLLWLADVLFWWLHPDRYVRRPCWIGWAVHGFMAFIVFNGAVVYASGPVRWVSAASFVALAAVFLYGMVVQSPSRAVVSKRLPS